MSGKPTDPKSTRRDRAEAILDAHLAGFREGEKLDIDALCAAHPDLVGEIRRAYGGHETRLLRPNGASEDARPGGQSR